MSDTNFCPCGSQKTLIECCLPVIEGKLPAVKAEQLLRARYTAFTRGAVDFILSTHHSKTRKDVKKEEIEDWSANSEWKGLTIHQVQGGGETDSQSTIIFTARYLTKGNENEETHSEKSFFEKENGQWRFLDAQRVQIGTFRRAEPKTGRNDPCPCGSGKKFKKCCEGKAQQQPA